MPSALDGSCLPCLPACLLPGTFLLWLISLIPKEAVPWQIPLTSYALSLLWLMVILLNYEDLQIHLLPEQDFDLLRARKPVFLPVSQLLAQCLNELPK